MVNTKIQYHIPGLLGSRTIVKPKMNLRFCGNKLWYVLVISIRYIVNLTVSF